ncbi:hypothetical protein INT47_006796 [Mucor saturninus]|uniref:Uncharacterized protein n=1 Tax=Mucor saturninus TaxID=64648 RepID=A0A8H7V2T5_9FUNG|nr:hypothetical protein INT47_006796 [Mucor saturninus]
MATASLCYMIAIFQTLSRYHPSFFHGVKPSFEINESSNYKLYKIITAILVSKWNSVSALTQNALDNNPKGDVKTYDNYKAAFKIISKEFMQQPSLVRFTKRLVEYMSSEVTRKRSSIAPICSVVLLFRVKPLLG